MAQVWKYVLEPEIKLEIPVGAELLSVGSQSGDICLWVKVDPESEKEIRSFVAFGTGHNIADDENLNFIGSAQLNEGNLVFHVFEKTQG